MLNSVTRFVSGNTDSGNAGRGINRIGKTDNLCSGVEMIGQIARYPFNPDVGYSVSRKNRLGGLSSRNVFRGKEARLLIKGRINLYLR